MRNPLERIREWLRTLWYCPYYKKCKYFSKQHVRCTSDWPLRHCETFRTFEKQEIDAYNRYVAKKLQGTKTDANKQKGNN
jgi:hypothetical protein